jgi:predicted exporter
VTLAFGSTLLGLAADYSFHFLVKMRATGKSLVARQLLLKGLVISCFTSIAAYLIQLFSPFPGLQQFAVFVASGLAAACVTVLLFGVLFKPTSPAAVPAGRIFGLLFEPVYRGVAGMRPWVVVSVVVIILLAISGLYRQGVTDDVRLLNTSGTQLIESEQKVQQLLGNFSAHRYFLIEGKSPQQVLQQVELLEKEISERTRLDTDQMLVSPTSVVPSLLQQQADYQLIQDKVFSAQGAAVLLCQALKSDCGWIKQQPEFNSQLFPDSVPQLLKSLSPSLALLKNNTAVVFFRDEQLVDEIAGAGSQVPGVTYVDQVDNLTSILRNFRQQTSWLLGGFYVCLVIFSLMVFARRGMLVIATVTFSSVIALSAAAGSGVTLFHVLALLLVIGIAVDTAVFFITPGLDRDTWTASTLACLTSVIAFGLLSLSQVPLLNQFGSVVFYGLICAWLVTPLFYYLLESNERTN